MCAWWNVCVLKWGVVCVRVFISLAAVGWVSSEALSSTSNLIVAEQRRHNCLQQVISCQTKRARVCCLYSPSYSTSLLPMSPESWQLGLMQHCIFSSMEMCTHILVYSFREYAHTQTHTPLLLPSTVCPVPSHFSQMDKETHTLKKKY